MHKVLWNNEKIEPKGSHGVIFLLVRLINIWRTDEHYNCNLNELFNADTTEESYAVTNIYSNPTRSPVYHESYIIFEVAKLR